MGRWLKKLADIRKSAPDKLPPERPSVSFVSTALEAFQKLKGKNGIDEDENLDANRGFESSSLPPISINDEIEQENTEPGDLLTILEPCCKDLGIEVHRVLEDLLSDRDKDNIAKGHISVSMLKLRLDGWKKNGMPRYVDDIDTRRYCSQCTNLSIQGQCLAAKYGSLANTSRIYYPITNILKNCSSYAPRTASQGIWEEPKSELDPFDDFLSEAQKAGLVLLPGDIKFLSSFGYDRIDKYLNQNIQAWLTGMNGEQSESKKQNTGRNRANTFIRNSLDSVPTKLTE